MMRWVVGSSLRFRFVVLVAGAAMLFFGGQKLRAMPVDAFPEFALRIAIGGRVADLLHEVTALQPALRSDAAAQLII